MTMSVKEKLKDGLFDFIGLGTWLLVFIIAMMMLKNADANILANRSLIVTCFIGYAIAFVGATHGFSGRLSENWQRICFALQLAFAFAILWMLPLDFLPILTIIWAAVSIKYFSPSRAILITTLVVIVWFSIYGIVWEQRAAIYSAFLYYTFHLFAMVMSIQTQKAERATQEVQNLNTELTATRELLAESSRVQERTRIARELHDLLGHHLTALNLNLQVASHLVAAEKQASELKAPVEQSYFLAKLLMSDVREAVSAIRENQDLNVTKVMQSLATAFPSLEVKVTGEAWPTDNIDLVQELLRCCQEAVTNAVKHGQATQVTIHSEIRQEACHITISNNGDLPAKDIRFGNGLQGMRERVELHKGNMKIDTSNNRFTINMEFPLLLKASGTNGVRLND